MRTKTRFFRIYADDRTVKEISFDEYKRLMRQNWRAKKRTILLCRVDSTDIYFKKAGHGLWIRRKQLKHILDLVNNGR